MAPGSISRVVGALVVCGSLAHTVPTADARLIAVVSQQGANDPIGIGQHDLRAFDALGGPGLGSSDPALRLPDAANTIASETAVSLSGDGRYLAFRRDNGLDDGLLGTSNIPPDRTFVADRTRATNSPIALLQAIYSDGTAVDGAVDLLPNGRYAARTAGLAVGRFRLDQISPPFVTLTPFGGLVAPAPNLTGFITGAAFGSNSRVAWGIDATGTVNDGVALAGADGVVRYVRTPQFSDGRRVIARVAAIDPSGQDRVFIAYNLKQLSGQGLLLVDRTDLGWADFNASPARISRVDNLLEGVLPGITASEERQIRLSPDGRYLGFLQVAGTQQRLQMYDRETQSFVNDGVDLGTSPVNSWDLAETSVTFSDVSMPASTELGAPVSVAARVSRATQIGILIQRITGTRRHLGRTVRRLKTVGRVPLGRRGRGVARFRWNSRVEGKRLSPGRYQVTMRSLTKGRVTDLARPVVIRVRAPGKR